MTQLDLSIVIVNWNTRDLLLRCLQAVYATVSASFSNRSEVIVVDNASTDDSVVAVRADFPQVKLIVNQVNMGFAKANNQGIRASKGRYILLLNSDAFVHEGTLEKSIAAMDACPDTGIAGCRLYYEDGSLQPSCFSFPTIQTEMFQMLWLDRLFPNSRIFGRFRMSYWDFDDVREVDSVLGAFMLLRKEALDQVGLMDESFFMYSEEIDLCYRMKQAGWKIRYFPEVSATHIWGGTSRQMPVQTFLNLYRSRIQFFRKHYGRLNTGLYKAVLYLGSLLRVISGYPARLISRNSTQGKIARNYLRLMKSLQGY